MTLSSDFIAGFCSETEADHQESLALLRRVRYSFAYCFPYSMREVSLLCIRLRPVTSPSVTTIHGGYCDNSGLRFIIIIIIIKLFFYSTNSCKADLCAVHIINELININVNYINQIKFCF